ncbi:hypothetical protein [Lysobacter gummosus]
MIACARDIRDSRALTPTPLPQAGEGLHGFVLATVATTRPRILSFP